VVGIAHAVAKVDLRGRGGGREGERGDSIIIIVNLLIIYSIQGTNTSNTAFITFER
jgi:hypothetical protein